MSTKEYGNEGEKLAEKFLKRSGYKIVDKNFTTSIGEIDIIAKTKKGEYVFVEVKRRADESFATPSVNVDKRKQQKIILVANSYLIEKKLNVFSRFDVIEIVGEKINHIIDAFRQ